MIGSILGKSLPSSSFSMVYDSLSIGIQYPLTISSFDKINQKHAPNIISNWSDYAQCKFYVNSNGTEYRDLTFSTKDALVTWVNDNIPHTTDFGNVIIKVYDTTNIDIPIISKMYGVNRLYSGLVGSGNSRNGSINNCGNIKSTWISGHKMLRDMFVDQFSWSNFLDTSSFMEDKGAYACWTSRNSKKKYYLPKSSIVLKGNGGDRRIACNNFESFQPVTSSDEYTLSNPKVLTCTNFTNGTYSIYNPFGSGSRSSLNFVTFGSNLTSSVVFFGLSCVLNESENNCAIFIKPLGIDSVVIDYIDFSKYTLEAILVNRLRQKYTIKKIDQSSITRSDYSSNNMTISKESWVFSPFIGNTVSSDSFKRNGVTSWEVYFRLRDSQGDVGSLSSSRILAEDSLYGFCYTIS